MRCLRTLVLLGAACWICAAPAHAECVTVVVRGVESGPTELWFEGTVLALEPANWGNVATMQVHRVWNGTLPAQFELFASSGIHHPQLELGKRYVLAINRLSAPDPTLNLVYRTMACFGVERDEAERSGLLDKLGPGRRPGR